MFVRFSRWRSALPSRLRALGFRCAPRLCLRFLRVSRAELGLAGEELAARTLLADGWRLRGRRVRTKHGEVDLWATNGRTSLVVEVKTGRLSRLPKIKVRGKPARWDLRWRPAESLTRAQTCRLMRAARFLAATRDLTPEVRLIEVLVSRDGKLVEVLRPRPVLEPSPAPYTHPPP